jgi:uncharacterized membrane protein
MTEAADFGFAAAILAMTAVTYVTRISGFWLMSHVPVTPRIRKMLEALPGAVVAATVTPIIVRGGGTAMLAVAAAVAIMIVRRNELLALAGGLGVAALVRFAAL